jgi:hypothetical protein
MGKGVAQLSQGRESPLHWGLDQSQTTSEGDLGAEGTQGPIGQEKAVTPVGCRGHQGLKQVLKGGIDPGNAHQHRTPAALLEHLQGDAASTVGCRNVRRLLWGLPLGPWGRRGHGR